MRRILSLIVVTITFYIGMVYFPQYIFIDSIETLIISSVAFVILGVIIGKLLKAILNWAKSLLADNDEDLKGCGCVLVFMFVPIAIITTPIRLWILEYLLNDFKINGFWTYVLLSLIFVVFQLNKSENKDKMNKSK